MNGRRSIARLRGEEGTSLVIAMAFLGLLATTVVSMLAVTFGSLKTTQTIRGNDARLYGADGGIEYGIETLRSSTSYCPDSSAGAQSLPSQTINGKTVTITCQTLSGGTGGGGGSGPTTYALVVTGYSQPDGTAPDFNNLIRTSGSTGNSNDTISFGGLPAFNAGGFNFSGGSPKLVFQDDLDEYDPYCTTEKSQAASSNNPQVQGVWTCRQTSSFPVPDPNPTVKVPTTTAPAATVLSDCTIYYPGKYTADNLPQFQASDKYYFASGVYYLEGVGEMQLEGQVFGGAPGPGETQKLTGITPCATDATANSYRPGSATGTGVEFVLGGVSRIKVANSSSNKVELYARQPANPALEGTPGLNIHAPKTSGAGYQAWNEAAAFIMDGSSPTVVFHGLVYIPKSELKAWSLPQTGATGSSEFGGGLVVGSLELAINSASKNVPVQFAVLPSGTPATDRTIVVTATSSAPGEAPVTETAVILVGTSATTPPTVQSWRKV